MRHQIEATDGTLIAVEEGGRPAGPPILFIHGYLFSSAAFTHQFEGALATDFRLLAMDLRGHGQSNKPLDPNAYRDPELWASDVASVLDALSVSRATIVGWSLGSRVALNYAWHHGFERIGALNLVAATLPPSTHNESGGLAPDLQGLLSDDLIQRRSTTEHFVDLCAQPSIEPGWRGRFVDIAMDVPVAARVGSRSWRLPYDSDFRWITAPTLITHGGFDPVVLQSLSESYTSMIPVSSCEILAEAGHLAFFQSPSDYDQSLAELTTNWQ